MARGTGLSVIKILLWLAVLGIAAVLIAYMLLPAGYTQQVTDAFFERVIEIRDSARESVGAGDKRLVATENGGADGDEPRQQAALPDDDDAVSRIVVLDGQTTVRLDDAAQARSGLRTAVLDGVTFTPEVTALGRVVDLQPLLAQRSRFASARAQADVVRASLEVAKADFDRLTSLVQVEGDIAHKRLLHAEAEVKRNAAELARFEAEMRAIREETRQQWGPVLASWALAGSSDEFERLLAREDALLLVTFPPGTSLAPGTTTVQVARHGERDDAVAAAFISPAPAADPMVQGETYFFRSSLSSLRAGMRVDVWAERSHQPLSGVIVPQDAVVWALGEAWAYVQIDKSHFARRPISTDTRAPGGWFVTEAVQPGDSIVVAGAQILYAEEFRWQIRDEDED